jgi:transcription termination factor Rho
MYEPMRGAEESGYEDTGTPGNHYPRHGGEGQEEPERVDTNDEPREIDSQQGEGREPEDNGNVEARNPGGRNMPDAQREAQREPLDEEDPITPNLEEENDEPDEEGARTRRGRCENQTLQEKHKSKYQSSYTKHERTWRRE